MAGISSSIGIGMEVQAIQTCFDGGRLLALRFQATNSGWYHVGDFSKCDSTDPEYYLSNGYLSGLRIRFKSSPN